MGTSYTSGFYLFHKRSNFIYKISEIVVTKKLVYIVSTKYLFKYDININAFIITDNTNVLSIKSITDFEYYPALPHNLSDGRLALKFKNI